MKRSMVFHSLEQWNFKFVHIFAIFSISAHNDHLSTTLQANCWKRKTFPTSLVRRYQHVAQITASKIRRGKIDS